MLFEFLHRRLQPIAWDFTALIATGELPRRGTIVNWLTRVQLRISKRLAFEIVHVSNGGPKDISNPAIDSIGFSVQLK